jgi:N-acetyl-beta-hexosaminidase
MECLLPQIGNPINTKPEFYTGSDYMEILSHAKQRNVEVIPEVNMPGHAHALKRAIESTYKKRNTTVWSSPSKSQLSVQMFDDNMLNPCSDTTYDILRTVIKQIASYHARAGVPLRHFHTGGDGHYSMERWVNSTDCLKLNIRSPQAIQKLFDDRVSRMIQSTGANVSGQYLYLMRNHQKKNNILKKIFVAAPQNINELSGFADGFLNKDGAPQDIRLFQTPEVTAHYWKNDLQSDFSSVYKLANAGYKVSIGF